MASMSTSMSTSTSSSSSGQEVKALLDQARQAIRASNPQQALQCVVQVLKLLHGDGAIIPALRSAALQYHAQQAAPIDEISELLSHVTLQAEQQQQQQQQQAGQQQAWQQQQQQQQQPWQHQGQAAQQQHMLQQQHQQQPQHASSSRDPILNETGRGAFTEFALADGSSWQCPHCGGVLLQERRAAHLEHWCPRLADRSP